MSIFDSIRRLFDGWSDGDRPSDRAGAPGDEVGSDASNGAAEVGPDTSRGDDDMLACEEALRLVNEYLDGELEDVPRSQVRRHFEMCARCYPHLKFEGAYREAVRRAAAGESAPPELRAKVSRLLAEARPED